VELFGKFFFTEWGWARPYGMASIYYNYHKVAYADAMPPPPPQTMSGIGFGNEEYTSSFFAGGVGLGVQFDFSKGFGLDLNFKYISSFAGNSNAKTAAPMINPDQIRLERIGRAFESSSMYSVNLGLCFKF